MYQIERRAGREVIYNTLVSRNEFRSLESYRSETREYLELASSLLPADWTVKYPGAYWCYVMPPEDKTPLSGFKIHLSSSFEDAELLLKRTIPVLVEKGIAFKLVVDRKMHAFVNSQDCTKSASGKFVTIYPRDIAEFQTLSLTLAEMTSDLSGPYILSDRRVEGSQVVFYRYGAFFTRFQLNAYGEAEPLVNLPDGRWAPDIRTHYFVLPDGVVDPFVQDTAPMEAILKNRYKAEFCLSNSNKGGVYLGVDQFESRPVILKEVRPHINRSHVNAYDALDMLKNEALCLRKLAGTGVVPELYDEFREWEHYFLVMERFDGSELASLSASEDFAINLQTGYDRERLVAFYQEILDIAEKILNALYIVHDHRIVITDLAPQNILYNRQNGELRFIDLEGANRLDDPECPNFRIGTSGFTNSEEFARRKSTYADDFSALGNILYSLVIPVTPLFVLAPERRHAVIERFMAERGGHPALIRLVSGLSEDRAHNARLMAEARAALAVLELPAPPTPTQTLDQLGALATTLTRNLGQRTALMDGRPAYRPDYRVFSTTHMNLSHGIAGIIGTLHQLGGELSPEVLRWFEAEVKKQDASTMAPGLNQGLAGLAWTLMDLGRPDEARVFLELARQSPLFGERLDLWYGAAGIGLACLRHHRLSGDSRSAQWARDCREVLDRNLEADGDTLFFRNDDDEIFHGLCHGNAGLALFFLRYAEILGDGDALDRGRRLLAFDIAGRREAEDHIAWPRAIGSEIISPYLRVGVSGMIYVLLRYHNATGDSEYRRLAEKAGRYLFGKFTLSSCLFNGMAGMAEMLFELFQLSGDEEYRDEALRFVERLCLFAHEDEQGFSFAGEDLLRFTDDVATGTAGIARVIHRLSGNATIGGFYDF